MFPSILFPWAYAALAVLCLTLGGCNLPKEDALFVSVSTACEEIGYGLSGASAFKSRMSEADKSKVEAIITRSQPICRDRNNPPSTTELASSALQLTMREIMSLVTRYAAQQKGSMHVPDATITPVAGQLSGRYGWLDRRRSHGQCGCDVPFGPRQEWAI